MMPLAASAVYPPAYATYYIDSGMCSLPKKSIDSDFRSKLPSGIKCGSPTSDNVYMCDGSDADQQTFISLCSQVGGSYVGGGFR